MASAGCSGCSSRGARVRKQDARDVESLEYATSYGLFPLLSVLDGWFLDPRYIDIIPAA